MFHFPHIYSFKTCCYIALGCSVGTLSTHRNVCYQNGFVVFIETLPTHSICFPNIYKSLQDSADITVVIHVYIVILSRG